MALLLSEPQSSDIILEMKFCGYVSPVKDKDEDEDKDDDDDAEGGTGGVLRELALFTIINRDRRTERNTGMVAV